MPCNSDYMMPSQQEINALNSRVGELKHLADEMVYGADVMRELTLAAQGDLDYLNVRQGIELSKRVTAVVPNIERGNRLLEKIKGEYAYKSGNRTPAQKAMEAYETIRDNYRAAHVIALKLIDNQALTEAEMAEIEHDQIEHRKQDLLRLVKVFAEAGDLQMIAKVSAADPTKELDSQLGFSPDDF